MLTEQASLVVVPAHADADGQLVFEARQEPDGPVLPVFSSVRVLAAALGDAQPWAVLPLATVVDAASAARVIRVVLDPEVNPDAWRWEQSDLAGFPGGSRRE
jgi:hypothetical protein